MTGSSINRNVRLKQIIDVSKIQEDLMTRKNVNSKSFFIFIFITSLKILMVPTANISSLDEFLNIRHKDSVSDFPMFCM